MRARNETLTNAAAPERTPAPGPARRRGFGRDEAGVTTLEFALVSPLIFAFFFVVVEFSVIALQVTTLDAAVANAARAIYTGEAVTTDDLETQICEQVFMLSDCAENIRIEAAPIAGFTTPPDDTVECVDSADDSFTPVSDFQTGAGGDIIFMRVCATTDLLLPFYGLGSIVTQTETGRFQIVSSLAFQNEPF